MDHFLINVPRYMKAVSYEGAIDGMWKEWQADKAKLAAVEAELAEYK